jgi:transposase
MLGRWKREIERDEEDISGAVSMKALQSALKRLRKENQRLKMEREILKKAAAFFAKGSE